MKQQLNRILCSMLALLLCVGLFMAGAKPVSAAETEGACGENASWNLQNGVLTISGAGPMANYNELFLPPWLELSDQIQRVNVDEGITTISPMAFYHGTNLKAVVMPDSVKSLGYLAFAGCTSLVLITMNGVEQIGNSCFFGCESLVNVTLPVGLKSIGDQAFFLCTSLGGITIPATVEAFGHSVFANCNSLVSVKFLAPLTVLPQSTFYSCDLLWVLQLPSQIEMVESNALTECDSLNSVIFGGSSDVREAIQEQLEVKTGNDDEIIRNNVSYTETENAIITTITTVQVGNSELTKVESGTVIHATILGESGWQEVVQAIDNASLHGYEPKVEVEVLDEITMGGDTLSELANSKATVTIHTQDNVNWEVILQDQTTETLSTSQNFRVNIVKNSKAVYTDVLKDAVSYTVDLKMTGLNSTVYFPLGVDAARKTATLFAINGSSLQKLCSVIVDDDGMAAYSLAGTMEGTYIIALNVQGISSNEVVIPQKLAAEYGIDYSKGTLTDGSGNQYIITGTRRDVGFGIGTLTLIIIGVLVGSAVVVGVVMTVMNKMKINLKYPTNSTRRKR